MLRDAVATRKGIIRSSSVLAMGFNQQTKSHQLTFTLALVSLVSSLWPQMAMSAPMPQRVNIPAPTAQHEEAAALSIRVDQSSNADRWLSAGPDDVIDGAAPKLRYGAGWMKGEAATKPAETRAHNQHLPLGTPSPAPQIHIIDNVHLFFSSSPDHAQHAPSTTWSDTSSPPRLSPSPPGALTSRGLNQDQPANEVFNIVIQREKTHQSAFIAPDVTWLRDLVPRVVDVVDQPETTIKETILHSMAKKNVDNRDRHLLVNIVKAQVDSQSEVPNAIARLANLMLTGEGIDATPFESPANSSLASPNRPVVINVVIVNVVLNVHVLHIVLPDVATESSAKARTPDWAMAEDSYVAALRESHTNRHPGLALAVPPPRSYHQEGGHGPAHVAATRQPTDGFRLTQVATDGGHTAGRPLMAMEKEYLRRYDGKRPPQPSIQLAHEHGETNSELVFDRIVDQEFVDLPTGPYFTQTVEEPLKIEILEVNKVPLTAIGSGTTPKPAMKRLKVKKTAAGSTMRNKAASAVRKQIRTLGFVAIPVLAGLASTVNAWLPAMAQLGRRRKRRSTEHDQSEEDWQPNQKFVGSEDRRRAIQDAQVLALLMGKRYMNVSKESLQESIDNWKHRDQAAAAALLQTTDANKLASTNRPLWFQFQRPNSSLAVAQATASTTMAPPATATPSIVKELNYYEEEEYPETPSNYNNHPALLFYSAAGIADGVGGNQSTTEDDDAENVAPPSAASGSTSTQSSYDYDEEATQSEEHAATTHAEPVTPHIHILPDTSPSGDDFDVVANFVQAMMLNGNTKDKDLLAIDGPQNREDLDGAGGSEDVDLPGDDVDGPEHRENIFFVKAAVPVTNSTKTSGSASSTTKPAAVATRLPPIGSGSTLSLFSADPIMPNWLNTSEKVTNSPVTYVAIRAPAVQASPSSSATKSTTASTESYDDGSGDISESHDQLPNDKVAATLQFHEDASGITFFVSKDVPSPITARPSASAGWAPTKPTSTGRPSVEPQWFSDPFVDGLFVGSTTTNALRPSVSSSSVRPAGRPSSSPVPPLTSLPSSLQSTKLPTSTTSISQSTLRPAGRPSSSPVPPLTSLPSSLQSTKLPTSTTSISQSTLRPSTRPSSSPVPPLTSLSSSLQSTKLPTSTTSISQSTLRPSTRPSSSPVPPLTSLPSILQSTKLPTSTASISQSTIRPATGPMTTTTTSTSQSSSLSASRPTSSTSTAPSSSLSGSRPTTPMVNEPSNFPSGLRPVGPPSETQSTLQLGNRPSTPSKFQSGQPKPSLLTLASFIAPPPWQRPALPPPVDVSNDMSTYTNFPSTVTTPSFQDLSTLTGHSSLVAVTIKKNNLVTGVGQAAAPTSPLPAPSTGRPATIFNSTGESSDVNQAFGAYSSTSTSSTSRPISTTGVSSEESEATVDNQMSQLEKDTISGWVSTRRPTGGLHFTNTSTDVVIISPYDATPSPVFSPLPVASGEPELEGEASDSSDAIVVDAQPGDRPDSAPIVSDLANFLLASPASGSSSGSSGAPASNGASVSSAGVTSSTSSVSVYPFPALYSFGLASAGILALTSPIWIPLVVAKKMRRTGGYGLTRKKDRKKKVKNAYPAKKKKTPAYPKASYGEPPPNHYKDLYADELPYQDDYYPAGPHTRFPYRNAAAEDVYRSDGPMGPYHGSDAKVDDYSPFYRDLFSSTSDEALHHAGPLHSEDVYGPSTSIYYDGRKAKRRRRSVGASQSKR